MNKYYWHRSKGLRAKQVVRQYTTCRFFPMCVAFINVGLKEVAPRKGKYKETGVTLSTEVSARVYDILLGKEAQACGVPDAEYNRRRWVLIV